MGRMLGVPFFNGLDHLTQCNLMESEFRKAQKIDRSSRPDEVTLIRAYKESKGDPNDGGEVKSSASEKMIVKWVGIIREKWQGHVIRRSSQSVDYQGMYINGLDPFTEHVLQLTLYQSEYDNLENLAMDIQEGGRDAIGSVSFLNSLIVGLLSLLVGRLLLWGSLAILRVHMYQLRR